MNELTYSKSYNEYRQDVMQELSKASESFVRIGYLLKVARDTDVLKGTEYESDYLAFAEGEFGLDKSQVSRFIRINDKFSVGGNSVELLPQYQGFGTRKLGIMIMLPEELTEELSPDYTVEEINEIKEVVKEEQEITPVEAMVERMGSNISDETPLIEYCIEQILEDTPDAYADIMKDTSRAYKILAPVSEMMYIVKVQGIGKIITTFHDDNVTLFNARTGSKETIERAAVVETIKNVLLPFMKPENPEESYSIQFGKEFPKKEEPKKEPKKIERVKNETKKPKKETEKVKKEPKEVKETPERTVEKPTEVGTGVCEEPQLSERTDIHKDISTVRTEIVNAYSYSHYDNALAAIESEDVVKTLYWITKDYENLKKIIDTLEEMKNDSSWREVDE